MTSPGDTKTENSTFGMLPRHSSRCVGEATENDAQGGTRIERLVSKEYIAHEQKIQDLQSGRMINNVKKH